MRRKLFSVITVLLLVAISVTSACVVLDPEHQLVEGCPGQKQTHTLTILNETDETQIFNLEYIVDGPGQAWGPAQIGPIDDGESREFDVFVRLDRGIPPGQTILVTVSATSQDGLYSDSATIEKYAATGCWEAPAQLQASFRGEPLEGEAPLTVKFTDQSDGNIIQWWWDFDSDDIIDSHQQDPCYTYTEPGTYAVTLSVTGADLAQDTTIRHEYITVKEAVTETEETTRAIKPAPTAAKRKPARLDARRLYISPTQVYPYDPVTISVDIVNVGGQYGAKTVNLLINGEFEQSTEVGVAPMTAQPISFTVYRTNPGRYEVNVEGVIGWLDVLQLPATPVPEVEVTVIGPPPTRLEAPIRIGGGLSTAGLVAVVVISMLLIAGIFVAFLFTRRPL